MKHARYVLCFTRADYRHSASGLEKYLTEEIALLSRAGISVVCIFPFRTRRNPKIDAWLAQFWGVVVDGEWRGFRRATELADWLAGLPPAGGGLLEIQLHHLQEYSLEALAAFLEAVPAPVRLFVHDYHAICSQYNLLRNGRAFCGPSAPSEEKCAGCRSWDPAYFPAMRAFLEGLRGRLEILVPSVAASRVFLGAYPDWAAGVRIVPHWRSGAAAPTERPEPAEALAIGFAGAPAPAKGWDVFLRASRELAARRAPYVFYHFGRPAPDGAGPVRNVPVSFVRDGRSAMTAALRKAGVDVVVLWSIWPETYCYVLYECLQAGALVVTHADSGNVADEVRRSGVGIVLAGEAELVEYLADAPRVRADVRRCRQRSRTQFGTMEVNDEIGRLIPREPTVFSGRRAPAPPARFVGLLYALKMAWRRRRLARRRGPKQGN